MTKLSQHKNENQIPHWANRLIWRIERYWEHHGPCRGLDNKVFYEPKTKSWQVHVSPRVQEIRGGIDDGKAVWTPFIFDAGRFSRTVGVEIRDFAVISKCDHCALAEARFILVGKFRGHRVVIHILVEPAIASRTGETIERGDDVPF